MLNKSKWKGGTLQIETAKESFLHRCSSNILTTLVSVDVEVKGHVKPFETVCGLDWLRSSRRWQTRISSRLQQMTEGKTCWTLLAKLASTTLL